jgi:hypothetical protein
MGRTPGVLPPGEAYYQSAFCKIRPQKLLKNDVHLLQNKGQVEQKAMRRILSSKDTKRPDAWNKDKHVTNEDIKYVEFIVEEMLTKFCPFYEQGCVMPGIDYIFERRGFEAKDKVTLAEWKNLPVIEDGSWGSCALVGLADTMLNKKKGSDIDRHDTVIRLGEVPLAKYKEFVGTKTDAIWVRRSAKMAPKGTVSKEHAERRWYIGHNNGNTDIPTLKVFAHSKKTQNSDNQVESIFQPAHDLYARFIDPRWNKRSKTKAKERKPSSGFADAILLISSKYCQRLDLYGFSANCGGAYYNTGHLMQKTHNCELESWFLHYIMKNHEKVGLCVHT